TANCDETVRQLRSMLSTRCVPVQLPIGSEESFKGLVDLVELKAYMGDKATAAELPADMADAISAARDALVEAACEADDELINKFVEGEEITTEEIKRGLSEA